MGKKHKHPEHENLERWLVSYADFITLLFATFVVLYALSQADLAKFKDLSKALHDAFNPAKSIMENPGGVLKGDPKSSVLKDTGNSILNKVIPKFPPNAQREGAIKPLTDAIAKINQDIQKINIKNGMEHKETASPVQVKLQERGVVISLASSLFFAPGSAELKPESFGILDKIAPVLKTSKQIVHIEGHTDDQPIYTIIYPSNWELSAARASSVVRYFIKKHGFDPSLLAAVGYAHTRPVAPNNTDVGRQKNRRVDIVILSTSAAKEADAGPAQKDETIIDLSSNGGIGQSENTPPVTPIKTEESKTAESSKKTEVIKNTPTPQKTKPLKNAQMNGSNQPIEQAEAAKKTLPKNIANKPQPKTQMNTMFKPITGDKFRIHFPKPIQIEMPKIHP